MVQAWAAGVAGVAGKMVNLLVWLWVALQGEEDLEEVLQRDGLLGAKGRDGGGELCVCHGGKLKAVNS